MTWYPYYGHQVQAPTKLDSTSGKRRALLKARLRPKNTIDQDTPHPSAAILPRLEALGLFYEPKRMSWDKFSPVCAGPAPFAFLPPSDAPERVTHVSGGKIANSVSRRKENKKNTAERTRPRMSHADITLPQAREILITTCALPLAWPLLRQRYDIWCPNWQ